jgi:DNA-binding PadR family transcriptional regulator
MPEKSADPESLLPLTPAVFYILLALSEGEMHGYAIMHEVSALTEGKLKIGPGTLYGAISRLVAARLIEESDERPDPTLDDERRRYYRLTPFGKSVASAETRRLEALVRTARAKRLVSEFA